MTRWIRGSLLLVCRGDCERFLRLCADGGIPLWGLERTDGLDMKFWCAPENLYRLRCFCRRANCSLHVLKKRGAPFALRRLLRRPVLIGGLALTAALLWVMGSRVWNIQVTAAGDFDTAEVCALLPEAGVYVGMPIRQVRAHLVRNAVMSKSEDVAFLTVNVKGTTAYITVYPRSESADITPAPQTSDIVSGLTGIITDIRIKNGTSNLRKWQSIYEGDLIATGEMVDQKGNVRYVRADAEIDVRTLYTRKCAVAKELFELKPTENVKKRRYLVVGNRSVKLYLIESIGFKWYYKSTERKTLSLKEDFPLPVTLITETYTECTRSEYQADRESIEQLMRERMTAAFMMQKPYATVTDSQFTLLDTDGAFEGILRLECSETTGIEIAR